MNRHMPYCSAAPLVPCPPPPPPPPHPRQAYNINIHRTFQLPSVEPLGADWGEAELRALTGAAGRCAAAIRLTTGNADPEIAAARRAAAYAISVADALPRGEQRQAVLDKLAEARRMAEEAAAASKLPATMVRAGKVQRRANHRGTDLLGPGQRVVKPLLNRRGSKKRALVDDEAINHGDEFQKRPRKGKETNKVGGVHGGGGGNLQAPAGYATHCQCHAASCCSCAASPRTWMERCCATAPRTSGAVGAARAERRAVGWRRHAC